MSLFLLFILLLAVSFAVVFYMARPTKTERAVERHLESIKVSETSIEPEPKITILKEEGYSPNPLIGDFVRQLPGAKETLALVREAGRSWPVSAVFAVVVASILLVAALTSLFLPGILALVSALLAGCLPYVYLVIQRERRFRECDRLLPEAVDLMARALRAGHALPAVLQMVGEEVSEPLGLEFRKLHEQQQVGLPLREAVMNMVEHIPSDATRFLATAILLQKETGGNLATILDKTAMVARERERLRGQVRVYTAQGRATAWILCAIPFLMVAVLSVISWKTERYLFTDPSGRVAVYIGVVLMVCGVLLIRRIVNVKV